MQFEEKILKIFEKYGYNKSIEEGACVDYEGNPIPWYTYPAIEYLSQFNYSDKNVFEFGCGNSSLWWANRAKNIISVDNNEEWYNSRLKYNYKNLKLLLKKDGESYVNSILEEKKLFDVIIIDGVYRDKCAEVALKCLATNGMIIFDNTDRVVEFEEYANGVKTLKNSSFIQVDFYGFGPLNPYTWTTSIFLPKTFNFKLNSSFQPKKGIGQIWEKKK